MICFSPDQEKVDSNWFNEFFLEIMFTAQVFVLLQEEESCSASFAELKAKLYDPVADNADINLAQVGAWWGPGGDRHDALL
jgi:hypothetical protein